MENQMAKNVPHEMEHRSFIVVHTDLGFPK